MPYEWTPPGAKPMCLRLWPYRSLPKRGFAGFIGGTALLICLPLLAVLGSPVLWGLLPFVVATIAGLYWSFERNYRDAEILEQLTLTPGHAHLHRVGPRGKRQEWQANLHWIRVEMHATGGPVPHYITLRGGPREVEIGAFLTPQERIALYQDLRNRIAGLA